MDELRPLWVFVQVVRHGSLSDAAQALDLTPAAVSKSVSRLEARLGTALFHRTSGRLQLSDAGERLFQRLEGAFGDIGSAIEALRDDSGAISGTVRLSTVTGVGRTWVMPLLPGFFERYPDVRVLISLHDGARGLSRQRYDLRINWGEDWEQSKVVHRLFRMDLVLVASPGYLERHGRPRRPAELARHHCISVGLAQQLKARWTFIHRDGRTPPMTLEPTARVTVIDELSGVVDAARAGLGLTVVTRDLVADDLATGRLVSVLGAYRIEGNATQTEVVLQHPPRRQLSTATAALVDYLVDHARQRSGEPGATPRHMLE